MSIKLDKKDKERLKDFLLQLIVGLICTLFGFWLTKTFGQTLDVNLYG